MKSDRQGLKIGFDAKRLFNNKTGLGNYSRTLVKNIQKFYPEHEYHLFTDKIGLETISEDFIEGPFKIHISNARIGAYWRTYGVSKLINYTGLDIFHGLSHEIPFGIKPETKTLVTFHDLIYEFHAEHFNIADRLVYQLKYRSSAKRADHIVAISNETRNDLMKVYSIPKDKISIVYQSPDNSFISQPADTRSFDYFLFVGSIIERKGLQYIIEAYSILPESNRKKCLIIGSGNYKSHCIKLIQKYKLSGYFEFLEEVDNRTLSEYYDNCIALLLPSIKEGFGIPIIESLFRKKPVITTIDSAMSEAAGPGGILVQKGNVTELSDALIQIQNLEFNSSLAEAGYQFAVNTFDPGVLSKHLMQVYFNILEGQHD